MFVLVTVGCLWVAWEAKQARARREVIRLLEMKDDLTNFELSDDFSWRSFFFGESVSSVSFRKEHAATLYPLLVRTKAAFPKVEFWQRAKTNDGPTSSYYEQFYGTNGEFKNEPEGLQ